MEKICLPTNAFFMITVFAFAILFFKQKKKVIILQQKKTPKHAREPYIQTSIMPDISSRDTRVLKDDLYPPLARGDRNSAIMAEYFKAPAYDTFRQIGYLANSQDSSKALMLFGRALDHRGSLGEFYVTTTDATNKFKYTLDRNNSNLRRIDDLPNEVTINGDLVSGSYKLVELKKGDPMYGYV